MSLLLWILGVPFLFRNSSVQVAVLTTQGFLCLGYCPYCSFLLFENISSSSKFNGVQVTFLSYCPHYSRRLVCHY